MTNVHVNDEWGEGGKRFFLFVRNKNLCTAKRTLALSFINYQKPPALRPPGGLFTRIQALLASSTSSIKKKQMKHLSVTFNINARKRHHLIISHDIT